MATNIETDTAWAPASWASYLINGDCSGLAHDSPDEVAICDAWQESLAVDGWHVMACEGEPEFMRTPVNMCHLVPWQAGDFLQYSIWRTVKVAR